MNSDAFKDRLKVVMNGASNHSFAAKCAISEGTVRRYLKGDAFPPLDTLQVIADVSGYSLGWLVSGEGLMKRGEEARPEHTKEPQPAYSAPLKVNNDADLAEIVDILKHDLPEAKRFVLKVLRGRKETKEGLEGLGLKLKEEW